MKRILYLTIFSIAFLFGSCNFAYAQGCAEIADCNAKINTLSQMVQKLSAVKRADDVTATDLQLQISALKVQVRELELAKQTPCTIAIKFVSSDLEKWHELLDKADKSSKKQYSKTLDFKRETGKKIIKAQCGFKDDSQLMKAIKFSAQFLPLLYLL